MRRLRRPRVWGEFDGIWRRLSSGGTHAAIIGRRLHPAAHQITCPVLIVMRQGYDCGERLMRAPLPAVVGVRMLAAGVGSGSVFAVLLVLEKQQTGWRGGEGKQQ